ncbi:Oidioi.mRNA.OKI2018_I69.chr1.g3401.t1.cds [Oikopleura dioica]|uniref:Oidioi.mRNA.OKI2018_I69.chr1.g3401.t1.cds n=1 Tax=Oikopleura dioica TaxID=34765 RepID=A0ABN7SU14_OIKDI|nr:Oidioi.mRNA.OKI2018_I69.chr1.g3401.t1.cds [Oikopleura dioica]
MRRNSNYQNYNNNYYSQSSQNSQTYQSSQNQMQRYNQYSQRHSGSSCQFSQYSNNSQPLWNANSQQGPSQMPAPQAINLQPQPYYPFAPQRTGKRSYYQSQPAWRRSLMDQKNAEAQEKTRKMQLLPSLQKKKGKIGSAYEDFMKGCVEKNEPKMEEPAKKEPEKEEPKAKDYDSDETIVSDDESIKKEITPKRSPVKMKESATQMTPGLSQIVNTRQMTPENEIVTKVDSSTQMTPAPQPPKVQTEDIIDLTQSPDQPPNSSFRTPERLSITANSHNTPNPKQIQPKTQLMTPKQLEVDLKKLEVTPVRKIFGPPLKIESPSETTRIKATPHPRKIQTKSQNIAQNEQSQLEEEIKSASQRKAERRSDWHRPAWLRMPIIQLE